MINPNALKVWYHRISDRSRGTKTYHAGFDTAGWSKLSRKQFKTATEAVAFGDRVVARWKKLYQTAILMVAIPTPVE